MVDDYYPPTDDEPPQPQQPQPPEGFVPYQAQQAAQPPEGFVPYKPSSSPPPGFVPHRPQAAAVEPVPSLPPIKSAPPTATPEERRDIYGDEPLGLPRTPGGLSSTAGATVTSTVPTQDIPAPITNKAGETLPTYILKTLGGGLENLAERITRSSGQLQRQGDVYDPAPGVDVMRTLYGARVLGGPLTRRPFVSSEALAPRPVTAGPRITPEGQYQLPLEGTHRPEPPSAVPVGPQQGELPLGPPLKADDALKRQGQTPGSTAAPGVAQEPNPPAAVPVADAQNKATLGTGALEKGGENLNTRDYGKTTPAATGEASGVNVIKDGVDPTVASTFKPAEPPTAAAPAVPPPVRSGQVPTAEQAAAAQERIAARRQPVAPAPITDTAPPNVTGKFETVANPDGPGWVIKSGDTTYPTVYQTKGPAYMDMNRLARGEAPRAPVSERAPVPAGTLELSPVEVRPGEPPLEPGMTRLYRGDTALPPDAPVPDWVKGTPGHQATVDATGRWFNPTREAAEYYNQKFGDKSGKVSYVDVPKAEADAYLASRQPEAGKFSAEGRAAEEHFVPREVADRARPLTEAAPAQTKFSLKKDDVATAAREEKHGGSRPVYSIADESGNKIGEVRLSRPFEHQLVIDDIKVTGGSYSGSLRKGMPLGPDVLKSFLRQIPTEFPEVTLVGGSRVSGARGVAGTDRRVFRKLSDLLADERGGGRLPSTTDIAASARAAGKTVAEFIRDERGGGRLLRTPAEEKILSRIAPESSAFSSVPRSIEEARSAWRKFYTDFKNELDPIEQLKHLSDTPVPRELDPGVLARLTRGLGGRIKQMLEDNTYSVQTRKITGDPLRTVIDKINVDPDGFTAYAMARTALERDVHGVKTGIPLKEANEVIAQTGAKWGPISNELSAFKNRVLDNAVDIIGSKAIATMKQKYPGHIPLYRMLDPASETGQALGAGLQVKNPLYRLKDGSELPILHPIDSIIKDTAAITDLAERNRVLLAMVDYNNTLSHNSRFMREVKDVHPIHITAAEVNKHLGVEGITEQVADGFKVFRKDAFRPAPDRIRVFRDGKATVYEVPESLGTAVNALDRESLGLLTKILATPAKMLRAGAVLAPEFVAKNPLRDQLAAFTQTKYGYIPVYDFAIGLKHLFTRSADVFQRWQIEGGANANLVSMDRKLMYTDPRTVLQHVANVVTTPYHLLQMASELMENATRLGVTSRAMKRGAHPIEATFESREGTLDFQRVGAAGYQKVLNAIIPFYNVAIEGTDRAFRALRDNPRNFLVKTAAGITLPSVALWYLTKEDERIEQLPRWRKDVAWNFPGRNNWQPVSGEERNEILAGMGLRAEGLDISKLTHTFRQATDGSWQYNRGIIWALPKPPGVGQLFGSIPERILDSWFKKNPDAFKELGKTIWQAFMPSVVPQVALGALEQWANKSMFLDRTLVPTPLQKLPTSQQFKPETSEVAKTIGQGIRAIAGDKTSLGSPIIVDNYIRSLTGGLGKHVTDIIDATVLRDKDAPTKPAWTAADIPLVKAFVARFPSADAQAIQQFYDTYDERKMATAGIKHLQKTGQPEDPSLLRENPVQGVHNALGVGFKTIRNIMADKNMSAEDKRTAMDLTYLFMIEKAKQGNIALEQSKRKQTPPPGFIPYQPRVQ